MISGYVLEDIVCVENITVDNTTTVVAEPVNVDAKSSVMSAVSGTITGIMAAT